MFVNHDILEKWLFWWIFTNVHESMQKVWQVVCGRNQTLSSMLSGMVAPQMGGLVYPAGLVLVAQCIVGSVYCVREEW